VPTNCSGARQSGSSPVALSVSTAHSGTCERSDPLDAQIDVGAALGSAEVGGRRHLLSNAESREYIESRVETPLKGKGPLIGSACLFTTRPHFLAEDL
jgi:hypothetical protein